MRRAYNEPLGQPRGSIRSVLAIVLVMAAVCGFFARLVDPSQVLALVIIVVNFYFLDRQTSGGKPDTTPAAVGTPAFTPKP